ncbi:unnamed protein product [Rotaria magnacalcarata]|uniref:Uncharacterized protein n=2 Tax=Rotaria magnacalcarata TaxID=392030 RepID=A0A815F8B7_9BILA|nr:unnamed protein product [Rotaria magnacalcarata]CAF2105042.1 unnamed protein product [Rotaria magnacalcarata]
MLQLNTSVINAMGQTINRTNAKNINTTAAYDLEKMIAYIRQNPNIALGIHHHLTEAPHLQQLNTSIEASPPQTPKRNLDSSDSNDAQISKQQRVLSNRKQKEYGQMNISTPPKALLPLNNNPVVDQHQPQISEHQKGRLPFEQLKRVVSSNLPCFFIEYDQNVNSKNRPSYISAASRISIGNTLCTITQFLIGNRMTFRTRCWCLGHMRDKCELENLINGQTHICLNRARCAQFNDDHQSLYSECDKVVEYRSELKAKVNNEISSGKLHQSIPQGRTQ